MGNLDWVDHHYNWNGAVDAPRSWRFDKKIDWIQLNCWHRGRDFIWRDGFCGAGIRPHRQHSRGSVHVFILPFLRLGRSLELEVAVALRT
jgi:hypothetical protein